MIVYRFGRWRYTVRPAIVRKLFSFIYKILYKFIQIITGIELPCETTIGSNFIIDHFGGIIVSGYAQFGDNCRIRNGVVVGLKNMEELGAPVIGNNVDIGAGAKILGKINIGSNVLIGANAVVIADVPDNSIAVQLGVNTYRDDRFPVFRHSRRPRLGFGFHPGHLVGLAPLGYDG